MNDRPKMNEHLRNLLAFFGLADYQIDVDWRKWVDENNRRLEANEEIEPPWGWEDYSNPDDFPYMVSGRDLSGQYIENVWLPFWRKLNLQQKKDYFAKRPPPEKWIEPPWAILPHSNWIDWRYNCQVNIWRAYWETLDREAKIAYLEKWQPPTDEWFEIWTLFWNEEAVASEIYTHQLQLLNDGQEVEPPWIFFPISFPTYGWDYGNHERWKLNIWIPFWRRMNQNEQENYLEKWNPPNEIWRKLITEDWAGKLQKSERWYASEIVSFGCLSIIGKPWEEFPDNPAVYEWDEEIKRKWLENIWIPTWNKVSEEERDAYLAYVYAPEQFDEKWLHALNRYSIKNPEKLENYFHRLGFLQAGKYDWDTNLINPWWKQFPKLLADKSKLNRDSAERWTKETWLPLWNDLSEDEQNEYVKYLDKYVGLPDDKWLQIFRKYEVRNLQEFEGIYCKDEKNMMI